MSATLFLISARRILGASLSVTYTGTAGTISTPLPAQTSAVMVWTSTAACVRVANGTASAIGAAATTADVPLPGSTPVVLPVELPTAPGTSPFMWVSAIQLSAGGTLYVQPLVD